MKPVSIFMQYIKEPYALKTKKTFWQQKIIRMFNCVTLSKHGWLNKNFWMTTELFKEWLEDLDNEMQKQKTKVC